MFSLIPLVFALIGSWTTPPTGPSYGQATIVPVAFHWDGAVLCKTYYEVNEMGAHAFMDQQYGWLIVDNDGTWEEAVWAHLPGEFSDENFDWKAHADSVRTMDSLFALPIDLSNPPQSAIKLIVEYGIHEEIRSHSVWSRYGNSLYFWTTDGITNGADSIVISSNDLKGIEGIVPDSTGGTRIGCSYAINGVLFFDSYCQFEPTMGCAGASYFREAYEYGLDAYNCTGIAILPKSHQDE